MAEEEQPVINKNEKEDNLQDPNSPYYLHPTENAGSLPVSPVLEGPNYHTWSRLMMRALLSKNKFPFVDGTIREPAADHPLHSVWVRCNTMVISWITRSISSQIAQSIVYIDNAYDLWSDLKERFSKGDYFRMSDMLQDLHSTKQGERTIASYFTDLKILWYQGKKGKERKKEEKAM